MLLTGYTACIVNGDIVTGKDFLLRCARAFGVMDVMRNFPLSAPIPECLTEDSHYSERLLEMEKELEHYKSASDEQLQQEIDEQYAKDCREHEKHVAECKRDKEALDKVQAEVMQWNPPTKDHEELKIFALDQIKGCLGDCTFRPEVPKRVLEGYRETQIKHAEEEIEFCTEQIQRERERVVSANEWLVALRKSIT